MLGLNQSFASVSQPARITRLRNSTFHVTECVRRIDRFDPDCATLQNEATTRVIEFYGIRSAFSIQVIREVFTAKQGASNALARGSYGSHIHNTERRFAHRYDLGITWFDIEFSLPITYRCFEGVHLRHLLRHRVDEWAQLVSMLESLLVGSWRGAYLTALAEIAGGMPRLEPQQKRVFEGLPVTGTYDEATQAAMAEAVKRPVSPARKDITADELKEEGSRTIATADNLSMFGKAMLWLAGVTGGGAIIDWISDGTMDTVQGVWDRVSKIPISFILFIVFLVVSGLVVMYVAEKINSYKVEDYASGRLS